MNRNGITLLFLIGLICIAVSAAAGWTIPLTMVGAFFWFLAYVNLRELDE